MLSRTLRRRRKRELQANRKTEPSCETQSVENQGHAVAIAARLRAMLPWSTDPEWLEKMAREVESRARQR